MLNPAFHRCPEAGGIVGRIMAGYGELELGLGLVVVTATGQPRDSVLREMFQVRYATTRLNQTRDRGLPGIRRLSLEEEYLHVVEQIRECMKLRHTFAHCIWADNFKIPETLFYTSLEEAAAESAGFDYTWRRLDLEVLHAQEAYCVNTRNWLIYLEYEARFRVDERMRNVAPQPPALGSIPEATVVSGTLWEQE
jgi:hypothetical protein